MNAGKHGVACSSLTFRMEANRFQHGAVVELFEAEGTRLRRRIEARCSIFATAFRACLFRVCSFEIANAMDVDRQRNGFLLMNSACASCIIQPTTRPSSFLIINRYSTLKTNTSTVPSASVAVAMEVGVCCACVYHAAAYCRILQLQNKSDWVECLFA